MNLSLKSGYCAVQHASFWFSMCAFQSPAKQILSGRQIHRCVLINGSCKFFRESSKLNAVERHGACKKHSTQDNHQRENADKY